MTMPKPLERVRLKDRILESISRAVKQIQSLQQGYADLPPVQLTNESWHVGRLVEHLDHAFLHGLRHITNGYWVLVKEFTHKSTVREIQRLQNVTTNLGRGRAWLYHSLVDQLLESYMRCFVTEQTLVKKYYVKEALVLDPSSLQVLLTLVSGLEYVTFQLELDVAYLDLSCHLRPRSESLETEDDDQVSLTSFESNNSQKSSHNLDANSGGSDSTEGVFTSLQDLNTSQKGDNMKTSTSLPAISEQETDRKRIERLSLVFDPVTSDLNNDLEVIRVKPKSRKRKGKRRGDLDVDDISLCSQISSDQEEKKLSVERDFCLCQEKSSTENIESWLTRSFEKSNESDENSKNVSSRPTSKTNVDTGNIAAPSGTKNTVKLKCCDRKKDQKDTLNIHKIHAGHRNISDDSIDSGIASSISYLPDGAAIVIPAARETQHSVSSSYSSGMVPPSRMDDNASNFSGASDEELRDIFARRQKEVDEDEVSIYDVPADVAGSVKSVTLASPLTFIEVINKTFTTRCIYKSITPTEERSAEFPNTAKKQNDIKINTSEEASSTSHEQKTADKQRNSDGSTSLKTEESHTVDCYYSKAEVKVGNNLLLLLMLNVFKQDDEQLTKMWLTSLGHSEGNLQPVYLLITNMAVYMLFSGKGETRFSCHAVITLSEIDYISLSLNYQIINIVCTNRRKQFWVTTGDSQLTKCIVGTLDKTVRESSLDLPRLSILTDATTQKISLRKWAARETGCQTSEVHIASYSLVHWVDTPDTTGSVCKTHASKQGVLMYKTCATRFAPPTWRPAYFVLRDGVLFKHADRKGESVPNMCLVLNEECGGCRRTPLADRDFSFEVILTEGASLQLSAANDYEAQDWLQSLCQAVAEGMGGKLTSVESLPCCSVVTSTHVLMCHEEVATHFFRTQDSVRVTEITGVLTDPQPTEYLVLTLESSDRSEKQTNSDHWTLYFKTVAERDNYISALNHVWSSQFQVSLPVQHIENEAMQKKCRQGQSRIQVLMQVNK